MNHFLIVRYLKHFQVSFFFILDDQQSLSKIRPSIDFYYDLVDYDKELSAITNQNFNDELKVSGNRQTYLSRQINNYSLHIQRIDKYINNAIDLSDKFRRVSFFL